MKAFCKLSDQELLDISQDLLTDSIKVEAIERGIKPRIPLSVACENANYIGHWQASGDTVFYELDSDGGYGSDKIVWMSEEQAVRALDNAMVLESTYKKGVSGHRLSDRIPLIKRVVLPGEQQTYRLAKVQEYINEDKEQYDALVTECFDKYQSVIQSEYNRKVAIERQNEYLRLAGGDVEIAQRFWAKAEILPWPNPETEPAEESIAYFDRHVAGDK